jgi:glycosyltransferase involved in cell wall biosynthesis
MTQAIPKPDVTPTPPDGTITTESSLAQDSQTSPKPRGGKGGRRPSSTRQPNAQSSDMPKHAGDFHTPPAIDLERVVAQQKRQIANLQAELRNSKQDLKNLRTAFDGVLESASWRITAPLRRATQLYRSALPLYRSTIKSAIPARFQNITSKDGMFSITGPTPHIYLSTPQGLPSGWFRITSDVQSSHGHLSAMLSYRRSHQTSFDEADRVWITLSNEERHPILCQFPDDVAELRLDPFNTEADFALTSITFHELGSINVAAMLGLKYGREIYSNPRAFWYRCRRAVALVRSQGVSALAQRLMGNRETHDYHGWVERYDTVALSDQSAIRAASAHLAYRPTISVIMPTYNSPELYLRKAIESVINQGYEQWELCIADDCSSEPHVKRVLSEYEARDPRIKVVYRTENGHISKSTNDALSLATGDFVAFLDHDDELTIDALAVVADAINRTPTARFLYSDEDKKTAADERFNPHFKSSFNPDLLLSQNYLCHLTVYARSAVTAAGGLREGYDGAQDWDLALRVTDTLSPNEIVHIPHVLYHWRVIEGSTAQSTSYKPYVLEAQRRSVEEHLSRNREAATVSIQHDIAQLRVTFAVPSPEPKVSLVIPTRDMYPVLSRCVDSILEKTSYNNYEIVIVDNGSIEEETLEYFDRLRATSRVTILRDESPFNFSRLNNRAVAQISSPFVGLLNNDLEVINSDWLDEMVGYASRPNVGAVGARLYYPNGLLQHAGVILGIGGVAGHNHKGRPRHDVGYFNRIILPQALSAVTAACVVLRTDIYREVGGLDEENLQVAFNDIDFCLRIREAGFRVVYNPHAQLFHHESASRGYETTPDKFARFEREVSWMKDRWGDVLANDPYYNPNLTIQTEDFGFASPPRATRFWRNSENRA